MAQPQSPQGSSAGLDAQQPPSRAAGDGQQRRSLDSAPGKKEREQFRGFLDLPIQVGVQMGHKAVKFRELLALEVDSVIRMEKSAGENVDLLLENLTVGRGEIIVIEDMMGLRITDLSHPAQEHENEVAEEE